MFGLFLYFYGEKYLIFILIPSTKYIFFSESYVPDSYESDGILVPQANNDQYQAIEDQALIVATGEGVLANDVNDSPFGGLSASLIQAPIAGTLNLQENGSFYVYSCSKFSGNNNVYLPGKGWRRRFI